MILENVVKQASQILKNYNIDTHQLDAQIILSDIMKIPRVFLISNDQIYISKKIRKKI